MLSLVELLPELVPEPLVVPEPVPEPEPLTEPEPVPEPVPLVVPVRVDDDVVPSEHADKPIPRLTDITAAVNRYLWFFIDPPFHASNRYAQGVSRQSICHLGKLMSVQDLIWNVLIMCGSENRRVFRLCMN